jgi:hypothetical protein
MYTITEGKTTFTGETREEAEAMRDRIKAHHARLELAYSAPLSGTSIPMSHAELLLAKFLAPARLTSR